MSKISLQRESIQNRLPTQSLQYDFIVFRLKEFLQSAQNDRSSEDWERKIAGTSPAFRTELCREGDKI